MFYKILAAVWLLAVVIIVPTVYISLATNVGYLVALMLWLKDILLAVCTVGVIIIIIKACGTLFDL